MNSLLADANFKLIDHIHNLNNLYAAHGLEVFEHPDFTNCLTISETRNKNDVLLFYFALGYELRDWNETTIEDYGKIENLITQLAAFVTDTDQQNAVKQCALYFCHMYFVLDDIDAWIDYANTNKLIGRGLREQVTKSFDHLRLAIIALGQLTDSDNIIFQIVKEGEYAVLKRVVLNFVEDGRNPDISAIYLFADQLDNEEFWKVFANQVFKKVTSEIVK